MEVTAVNTSGMAPAPEYPERKQTAARLEASAPPAARDEAKPEVEEAPKAPEVIAPQTKAVLAVDDDKTVVVRIIDSEGKVLRQMPPEEYRAAAARLRTLAKSLLDMEA